MQIALINSNRIQPPIAPIGLEYVAEALIASGRRADILDLCWAENPEQSIDRFFKNRHFGLVGLTLRNTDDCAMSSSHSFLKEFSEILDQIRTLTEAVIVAGGVGFSTMPEQVMDLCRPDIGIVGDGEFIFPELADRIETGKSWADLPGIIFSSNGKWHCRPAERPALDNLPAMRRNIFNNSRYFNEGGQAGVEFKRGCSEKCIYCAEPAAKGNAVRLRPAAAAVDEIENLLSQGINCFHTCDSEFNLPAWHAEAVCEEIIRRRLGDKLQWYAYCTPKSFSRKLAKLMRKAGCVGINFGADSGDAAMLKSLKRGFAPEDILETVRSCKASGITTMLDLLIGAPGETIASITNTIDLIQKAAPDRVGVGIGVRIYPKTAIAEMAEKGIISSGFTGGTSVHDPLFFLEPAVSHIIYDLLDDLIKEDERFLFFNPEKPNRNYNYNANEVLVDAIARGHRGAYWDILRKII